MPGGVPIVGHAEKARGDSSRPEKGKVARVLCC